MLTIQYKCRDLEIRVTGQSKAFDNSTIGYTGYGLQLLFRSNFVS